MAFITGSHQTVDSPNAASTCSNATCLTPMRSEMNLSIVTSLQRAKKKGKKAAQRARKSFNFSHLK